MDFTDNKLFIIFLLLGIIYCGNCQAQRAKDISAEYTYVAPTNISITEAKRIAAERARIEALAEEFGTDISQTNMTQVKNSATESNVDFLSIGSSEVKGEWLRDTKEPEYDINIDGENIIIKVVVWGEAREIKKSSIELDVAILRNGTEKKFASEEFKNGDDIFVYFKSPTNGYVAIYLMDEENTAYCLLPYSGDNNGQFTIKGNESYIFFDSKQGKTDEERFLIDQLTLTCTKESEFNQIFVIFSPQPFTKAIDEQTGENIPRSLNSDDFQKWLTKNRLKDKDMTVVERMIKIYQ